jgi:hypothetical protein
MDEKVRLFTWALASMGFFGLLGLAFGCITGAITWRSGRAAGSMVGLMLARAFAQVSRRDLSPGARGAIIGATDGAVFLGILGAGFGLVMGSCGQAQWKLFGPTVTLALFLAGGAVFFGFLAMVIIQAGSLGIAGLFAGGMLGAGAGGSLGGLDGLLVGTITGVVLGTGAALVYRRS